MKVYTYIRVRPWKGKTHEQDSWDVTMSSNDGEEDWIVRDNGNTAR